LFVSVTAYHADVRAASRFKETDAGKALRTSRWPVEPTIAWLVRYQGCRQARRWGRSAARGQVRQACAVRNLLRWLNRTDRQRPHAEAPEQGGAGGRVAGPVRHGRVRQHGPAGGGAATEPRPMAARPPPRHDGRRSEEDAKKRGQRSAGLEGPHFCKPLVWLYR
jgi:hypothetical protein